MNEQHTQGDIRGIAARTPPAAAADPAMQAFEEALGDLIEFAAVDAIQASGAIPGGRGAYGPDVTAMEKLVAKVHQAARAAFSAEAKPAVAAEARGDGLLTVHTPGVRVPITP